MSLGQGILNEIGKIILRILIVVVTVSVAIGLFVGWLIF